MSRLRVDAGPDQHDFDMRGAGNGVVREPLATQRLQNARDRRVLCIHGCNTDDENGLKRTAAFRGWLIERCGVLQNQVFNVTWPGDVSWSNGGLFRYKTMKQRADLAGERLWAFLKSEYDKGVGARTLIIIAHSLGCRLAAQAVVAMAKHRQQAALPAPSGDGCRFPVQIILVLMGAAIPIDFDDGMTTVAAHAKIILLHSDRDIALKWVFPFGQRLAGEGSQEAIGLYGRPLAPPGPRSEPMAGYNHEHYWNRASTADAIAEQLRAHLPDLPPETGLHRAGQLREAAPLPKTPPLPQSVLGEMPI